MKLGLKIYTTEPLLKEAGELVRQGVFDYIESLVVPNTSSSAHVLSGQEVIIHAPHGGHGVNLSLIHTFDENMQKIGEAQRLADRLNAKYIIVHPGGGGTVAAIQHHLRMLDDNRIVVENLPAITSDGKPLLGSLPSEMKEILGKQPFCLDFSHAIKSALYHRLPYKDVLNDFLALKPVIGHICDGTLTPIDEHLNLGEGAFDIPYIKHLLSTSSITHLSFEVPKIDGLKNDVRNVTYYREL